MPAKPAARTTGAQPGGDKVNAAYQDLLKEIVEKKQRAAEVRRRPPQKRIGPVIKAVLAVILPPIVAAVWIFDPFAPAPAPAPRVPDERSAWQTTLIDAALAIRDWRDSAGVFPVDLEAADIFLRGVTFTVNGPDEFALQTFTSEGVVTVWMDGPTLGIGPRPVAPAPSPFGTSPP